MEAHDYFIPAAYSGTKNFSQQDIRTANATGFGAAADDYAERGIDLNEQLIKNKPATFFLRVNSDAMIGAGIHQGDVVIVDRSLEAKNGKVVIAVVDGDMLIRRLEISNGKTILHAADHFTVSQEVAGKLNVWGVVTYIIHSV